MAVVWAAAIQIWSTAARGENAPAATPIRSVVAPITITATRLGQGTDTVPTTVSVITSEEIEQNLVQDIKDLVRFEPGVSVRRSPSRFTAALSPTGRDGNSGFNIRGIEGNRVLIQVDGVRVPDGFGFGPQAVGRGDYVDLDLLKSVEILRGPASALYGSDGLAGAVSYITKDPDDLLNGQEGWSARLRGSYASADEGLSESVLLATGSSGWQGLVVFVRHDGHGQGNQGTNETASTARTAPNPQDASSNGVLAKLVRKISASRRLRLTYEHGDSEIDTRILSAITATTLDLVAHDTMNRDRVTLDHSWEGEGLFFDRAFNAFSYQIGTTRQFSAEDRTPAADRTRNNTFNNRTVSLTTELQSAGTTGALSHRFVYGGDISKTRQEGIRDGTIPPLGEVFPTRAFPNTDYVLAGLFLQDEITFGSSGIRIYPALRFDYYNLEPNADALYLVPSAGQSDEHLSPKLGLVWQASNWFQVFANYAQGFKAPAPSQVNSQFTNSAFFYTSIPNPNLKPETSETLEGGVRLSGSNWSAGATAFTGEYTDFIDLVQVGGTFTPPSPGDPDGDFAVFQNVNLNRVQINGAEARAQAAFDNGISLLAAASLARGSTVDAGVKAPFEAVDPWKLVGGISYVDPRGFGGQLFHTHSAQKQVSRVACGATCFRPEGFTIWDATAYWDITHDITLRAALFNITDETYWWWSDVRTAGLTMTSASRDAYTQPGRNISVSLALKI